jgi:hypothetical protein
MAVPTGHAAWTPDGVAVATIDGDQFHPAIVHDGTGGAIIVWRDDRSGGVAIYAQRLDADGNPMWTGNGILVCTVTWVSVYPVAVSDGLGGAYIIWSDSRGGGNPNDHLYAQRIGADGSKYWAPGGVEVCPGGGGQFYPTAITDFRPQVGLNTNGCIVVFENAGTNSFTLFAQRLDMNGSRLWGSGGVSLCSTAADGYAAITPDGTATTFFSSGAIVAWKTGASDIRANWINATGVVQWGADGLAICTATGEQKNPAIAGVGPRRAIIGWEDNRSGDGGDIYAQQVDNGAVSWTPDGVVVADPPGIQDGPQVAPAPSGAFITWSDGRDPDKPLNLDIYAQRVDLNGVSQWTADGIPVCGSGGYQTRSRVTPDFVGGIYVVWVDGREDHYDLRAQRADGDGNLAWDPEGVVVSGAAGDQDFPELIVYGEFLFLAWEDTRNSVNGFDIYAGRITSGGTVAVSESPIQSVPVGAFLVQLLSSNPQHGETRFGVDLREGSRVGAEVCDVTGRRVWKLGEVALTPGSHVLRWDGRDLSGQAVPSGVYFMRVESGERSSVLKLVRAR